MLLTRKEGEGMIPRKLFWLEGYLPALQMEAGGHQGWRWVQGGSYGTVGRRSRNFLSTPPGRSWAT